MLRSFGKKFARTFSNCRAQSISGTRASNQDGPRFSDTIYALASGDVKAGVSIIRISGEKSLQACALLEKKSINDQQRLEDMSQNEIKEMFNLSPRYAHFRKLLEKGETISEKNRQVLDKSILLYFEGPHSFTGEDVLELHIHGGRALQKKILLELSQLDSFRLAEPGEFTKRALLNNKLDLLEVEGLADMLNAETESQRAQSTKQFIGKSSSIFEGWRWNLIRALAHAEAFIDFESDQDDVEFNILGNTQTAVIKVIDEIKDTLADAHRGEILRDGLKVAIIGKPNAGKSTLLNCLARKDIAIISDIPGTTRDALSVALNISGFPVILYDTAGIRVTSDVIEAKGVQKAVQHAKESDINILILDGEQLNPSESGQGGVLEEKENFDIMKEAIGLNSENNYDQKTLVFVNKSDKLNEEVKNKFKYVVIGGRKIDICGFISAEKNLNITQLLQTVTTKIHEKLDIGVGMNACGSQGSIITQTRHRLELTKCLEHLEIFSKNRASLPVDIICEELRQAVNCIGRITGRVDIEEVLDVLFAEFCIGK